MSFLRCGRFKLSLERPLIMGVVNVTPDSFSDGGLHADSRAAIAHARRLIEEGADLVDLGGESTRPGAAPVSLEEERRRVLPVLEALAGGAVPVSVDTRKPALMREAIAAGASMVNDVTALSSPGALEALAGTTVAVCLMHMQGEPGTMQVKPSYGDVVREVRDYLAARVAAAQAAGIARERIVADPGLGSARRWSTTSSCCARWASSRASRSPCWPGCRARPCSAFSPAASRATGSTRASRRRSSRCRTARTSCGCTTWRRRETRSPSGTPLWVMGNALCVQNPCNIQLKRSYA